jgi:hypothetical protein
MTRFRDATFFLGVIAVLLAARPAMAIDETSQPNLHRADQQLYDALEALKSETRPEPTFIGHRDRAVDLIRQARSEIEQAANSVDAAQPPAADAVATGTAYAEEPKFDPPPSAYTAPPELVVYAAPPPPSGPVGFWGSHPIPGGGWCIAVGPHVHQYEPEFYDQFHLVDGYFKFGEGFHEWLYAGIHPIAGGGWCAIAVPHKHPYLPTVGFIYDPLRHGYYYDRERAVVIRTEIVRAPPHYRPPAEVIVRYRNPPVLRRMPPGTPRPQPWAHERMVEHRAAVARPAVYHPSERPAVRPGAIEHPVPARGAAATRGAPAAAAHTAPAAAKPAAAKPAVAKKAQPEKKDKK